MYHVLRAIVRLALRWYYRGIQVEGLERIPRRRPVLFAVNHPNALVDALMVVWTVPRRVLFTAKSTLFVNPVLGGLLRSLGVVPLRRAKDETAGAQLDPARNITTFRAVHDALRNGGAVLIFPEGITHDMPSLAPLKTGAARMALHARDAGDVPGLAIVPIGLTFERKDEPRSRVHVLVGESITVDDWRAPDGEHPADALTAEIEARLRAVTLNYPTVDDAMRSVRLASGIAALFAGVTEIGAGDRSLGVETTIARRIEELRARLPAVSTERRKQADDLVQRVDALQRELADAGLRIEDVEIDLGPARVARFVVREGWWLLIGGPLALWGRVNHWLPFHAARALAMRSIDSAADPAMRTLLAGIVFVLLTYLAQTAVVAALWGPLVGAAYLFSLPLAADINFSLSERLQRARLRARAFWRFRADPAFQQRLTRELVSLRLEATELDRALGDAVETTPA